MRALLTRIRVYKTPLINPNDLASLSTSFLLGKFGKIFPLKNFAKTHSLPPNMIYKIAQWVTNTQVGFLLNISYHNHLYCIQKGYSYNATHVIFSS